MEQKVSGFDVFRRLKKVDTIPTLWDGRRYSHCLQALYSAMAEVTLPGDMAQFGVYKGESARFLCSFVRGGRLLHLFDSFEGLPEDWGGVLKKGHFDLKGRIPTFDPALTRVYKGWFKETVPAFAESLADPLSFIHVDCDLYSSTMDILPTMNDKIAAGTIIVFDEYVARGSDDEHRALLDWSEKCSREFEYLWRSHWCQAAVRITK